jgi:hypothetical protein
VGNGKQKIAIPHPSSLFPHPQKFVKSVKSRTRLVAELPFINYRLPLN